MNVFLGGTCNGSSWRDELIELLEIDYFNPVVEEWTAECQAEEIYQRENSDFCLYVITSEMIGVYSIAEVVDDSNKRPDKTLFCFIEKGFTDHQRKSLRQVVKLVRDNGATVFESLSDIALFLNKNN